MENEVNSAPQDHRACNERKEARPWPASIPDSQVPGIDADRKPQDDPEYIGNTVGSHCCIARTTIRNPEVSFGISAAVMLVERDQPMNII